MSSINVRLADGTQLTIKEGDRYEDLTKNKNLAKLAPLFDLIDSTNTAEGGDKIVGANELALIEKALNKMGGDINNYDIDKYCADYFKSGNNLETFINTHAPVKKTVISQDGKTSQGAFNQYIQNTAKKFDKTAAEQELSGKTHKITSGDTLYAIAKDALEKEGIEPTNKTINERIAKIALVNNIKDVNNVRVGTEI